MKIFAISDFHGATHLIPQVSAAVKLVKPDLITFSGDIVKGKARGDEWIRARMERAKPRRDLPEIQAEESEDKELYSQFYRMLDELGIPAFVVPGNMDAPEERYLSSLLSGSRIETNVRLVHRSPRKLSEHIIAGFGGEISEDERETFFVSIFPRWEVIHAFEVLQYLPGKFILIFHSPPHGILDLDGTFHKGSPVVNFLVQNLSPEFVFVGHAHNSRGVEQIGNSIVVNPGALKSGYYAVAETESKKVNLCTL